MMMMMMMMMMITGSSNISEAMTHIIKIHHYVSGVSLSRSGTSDVVGRRCAPDIQDGIKLPEIVITSLVLQIRMSFQKQYRGL